MRVGITGQEDMINTGLQCFRIAVGMIQFIKSDTGTFNLQIGKIGYSAGGTQNIVNIQEAFMLGFIKVVDGYMIVLLLNTGKPAVRDNKHLFSDCRQSCRCHLRIGKVSDSLSD